MERSHDHLDPDLRELASALEEHRPELTGLELDRIKRRAMAGGARTTSATTFRPKGSFMRSRLAITTILAMGLMMSMGGAALGVSALSTSDSASVAQYGAPAPTAVTPPPAETLGGGVGGVQEQSPDQGVAGIQDEGEPGDVAGVQVQSPEARAQAPRQLQADRDGELPFTGFAAIPLLLGGFALLGLGLVLRRNTTRPAPLG